MTRENVKGIIAIIIFMAAIASVFIGDGSSKDFLIPLATFVFGYYFKDKIEEPITRKVVKAMRK
jgi:hypothetical protein